MENLKKDLKSLTLKLQELVQCSVCLDSLDDSVVLCLNGHGVCGECRSELDQCPACAAEFLPQKPTLLCQVLEMMPKLCPFTDKGCSEIMLSTDHQSYCPFRPVHCKMYDCEWTGCLRDLSDHLRTDHGECIKSFGTDIKINLLTTFNKSTSCISFFRPYTYDSNLFWVWDHKDRQSKRHIYRFYYLPTSKPTDDYYLIVSFKKDKIEFTCTVKACINMDNADRDIDVHDSGLMIPDDLIDVFLNGNETDQYSFTREICKK